MGITLAAVLVYILIGLIFAFCLAGDKEENWSAVLGIVIFWLPLMVGQLLIKLT